MAVMNYLKKMFRKDKPEPSLEYVHDEPAEAGTAAIQPRSSAEISGEMGGEIDLSRQSDLEGYAKDINVSKESIERWISSGLLMPEELKVAEKLVKIMSKH